MYSIYKPTDQGVQKAISLLQNQLEFLKAIKAVCDSWPVSSRVHLSNTTINRRAYLGRAASCIAHGVNEATVAIAWQMLPEQDQDLANETAQRFINEWVVKYSNEQPEPQLKLF